MTEEEKAAKLAEVSSPPPPVPRSPLTVLLEAQRTHGRKEEDQREEGGRGGEAELDRFALIRADYPSSAQAKANEAIRRKGGKDQSAIKAELALKEAVSHNVDFGVVAADLPPLSIFRPFFLASVSPRLRRTKRLCNARRTRSRTPGQKPPCALKSKPTRKLELTKPLARRPCAMVHLYRAPTLPPLPLPRPRRLPLPRAPPAIRGCRFVCQMVVSRWCMLWRARLRLERLRAGC